LAPSGTNVHRHSRSGTVDIALQSVSERISSTSKDYRRGIPIERLEKFRTWALTLDLTRMRERTYESGGSLEVVAVKSSHCSLLRIIRERSRISGWLATDPDAPPALQLLRHELVGKGRRHDRVRTSSNQSESLNKNLVLRRERSVPNVPVAS
jgi:hypothetical protein